MGKNSYILVKGRYILRIQIVLESVRQEQSSLKLWYKPENFRSAVLKGLNFSVGIPHLGVNFGSHTRDFSVSIFKGWILYSGCD